MRELPTVAASSRLDVALESLTAAPQSWVTVLDNERRVVGTLSISDMVRAYRQELVSERGTDERPGSHHRSRASDRDG